MHYATLHAVFLTLALAMLTTGLIPGNTSLSYCPGTSGNIIRINTAEFRLYTTYPMEWELSLEYQVVSSPPPLNDSSVLEYSLEASWGTSTTRTELCPLLYDEFCPVKVGTKDWMQIGISGRRAGDPTNLPCVFKGFTNGRQLFCLSGRLGPGYASSETEEDGGQVVIYGKPEDL